MLLKKQTSASSYYMPKCPLLSNTFAINLTFCVMVLVNVDKEVEVVFVEDSFAILNSSYNLNITNKMKMHIGRIFSSNTTYWKIKVIFHSKINL